MSNDDGGLITPHGDSAVAAPDASAVTVPVVDEPLAAHPREVLPWWAADSTAARVPPHRRSPWTVVAPVVVGLLLVVGFGWVAVAGQPDESRAVTGGLMHKPSITGLLYGCTSRFEVTDSGPSVDGTVPRLRRDKKTVYRPPAPHSPIPVRGMMHPRGPQGGPVFDVDDPADAWSVLRSLYDGSMVVYYTDDAAQRSITAAQRVAAAHPDWQVLVSAWDEWAGPAQFTSQRPFALAAWGSVQYCATVNEAVIGEFRQDTFSAAPGRSGRQPATVLRSWSDGTSGSRAGD